MNLLGEKTGDIIPIVINDITIVDTIFDLSNRLSTLKDSKGFSKHIKEYPSSYQSTYFVTLVASELKGKVDNIELEPDIKGQKKKPDIKFLYEKQDYYIECKRPIRREEFVYSEDHRAIAEVLKQYVNVPHQITIQYKRSLTIEEIHELGIFIGKKVQHVTSEGKIYTDDNVEVHVEKRDSFGLKFKGIFILDFIMQDTLSNQFYPSDICGVDGKTFVIHGPLVDYSSIITRQINKSSSQVAKGKPYILCISADEFLGDLSECLKKITKSFQPSIHTRFSGIFLVRYDFSTSREGNIMFHYISNPYSKFPLPKSLIFALTSSTVAS